MQTVLIDCGIAVGVIKHVTIVNAYLSVVCIREIIAEPHTDAGRKKGGATIQRIGTPSHVLTKRIIDQSFAIH